MSDARVTRAGQTAGPGAKTCAPSNHPAITNAARGIPDRTDTTLSFVAGTRTFTITPASGAFSYHIAGRRYIKSIAESIVITDVSGAHWIYYDGDTLSESVNPAHAALDDLIVNAVRIGIVYWNATDGAAYVVADERHGPVMSGETQEWLHDNIGATWEEGLAVSGYTLDTDTDNGVDFQVSDGSIHDEDIQHAITDGAAANQYEQQLSGVAEVDDAAIPILYRDDVDGSWTEDAATTLPYKTGGTGRLAYNNDDGDGTYSQIEVTDNKFVLATLIATNDWQYPIKMVQGQHEYTDQRTAVDEANDEQIAWGDMPSPEFVVLYRLVMRTKDTFGGTNKCKIVAVTDLRRLSLTGGLASPVEPHDILSATHSDSLAAAVVEGDVIVGNKTPEWVRLPVGVAGTFLGTDGTAVAWDATVVTAGANLTDHAVVRGDGGALGIQDSGVLIDDANAMTGLTELTVDNLIFTQNAIQTFGAEVGITLHPTGALAAVDIIYLGTATQNRDLIKLEARTWNAVNADTRTSIAFLHPYNATPDTAEAGRVTVGTETNWGAAAATRDAYMAFHTILDGTTSEKVRINSAGVVGINTTDPGSNIATNLLDIRQVGNRATSGLYTYDARANIASSQYGGKARGTEALPTIVVNGDTLFAFVALGYDGAAWKAAAQIIFTSDAVPGLNAIPTQIAFRTGPTAATIADRLIIQSDGDILVDSGTSVFVRDSALGFNSSVDGQLDLFADTECEITAPTIDLTAATAVIVRNVHGINYAPGADLDTDLVTVDVGGAPTFWWDESEDAFAMTHRLTLPAGVQTKYAVDDVADPPTDAQLDTAFGDPTVVGPGFVGILDDGGAGLYCYICWTTGTAGEWFYLAGTKAV